MGVCRGYMGDIGVPSKGVIGAYGSTWCCMVFFKVSQKLGVPLGAPIIRIVVYWGLFRGYLFMETTLGGNSAHDLVEGVRDGYCPHPIAVPPFIFCNGRQAIRCLNAGPTHHFAVSRYTICKSGICGVVPKSLPQSPEP